MATPAQDPDLASSPNNLSLHAPHDDDDQVLDDSYFSSHEPSMSRSASADPLDALENPPSPGASSTASSASVVDSLAGAPYADVEAKALEFLSASPPTTAPDAGFTAKEIPARIRAPGPTTDVEAHEAQAKAVEYLRKMLDDAERDEWLYDTPAVFHPSRGVGIQDSRLSRRNEGGPAVDGLDEVARTTSWADRAFNLERWQVDGLGGVAGDEGSMRWEAFEVDDPSARSNDSELGMFV
ncbi:hypothetical protein JCM10295v2_003598 [Rhodotorula toruloides]